MACLHRKGVHCLIYKLQLHFYSLEIFVCTINNQDDVHNIYIYIYSSYNLQHAGKYLQKWKYLST